MEGKKEAKKYMDGKKECMDRKKKKSVVQIDRKKLMKSYIEKVTNEFMDVKNEKMASID